MKIDSAARAARMAEMFRSGQTLAAIGEEYGVSRERVRQIISKHHGLRAEDGGISVAAKARNSARADARERRCLEQYGCTYADWRSLALIGRQMIRAGASQSMTPIGAYCTQRHNAKKRGIEWRFTLWSWWQVWHRSGKWEFRGRGQGYVMCRHGDEGAYAPGNVFIALHTQNSSEIFRGRVRHLPIGVQKCRRRYHAQRMIGGTLRSLGYFLTPEEAHAAYIAAAPEARRA
jgi:hypothetical protein